MLITRNIFLDPFKRSQFSLMCRLDNFILGLFRNIPKVGVIIVMLNSLVLVTKMTPTMSLMKLSRKYLKIMLKSQGLSS